MNYSRTLFLTLITALASGVSFAQDTSISAYVAHKAGVAATGYSQTLSRDEINISTGSEWENSSFKTVARGRRTGYLTEEAQNEFELQKMVWEGRKGGFVWQIGRQICAWGKADGFRVLDAVNPYDYSEFTLNEPASAKKALAMALVEYSLPDDASIQAIVTPEYREDTIPGHASRFGVIWPQAAATQKRATRFEGMDHPGDWQYGLKVERNLRDFGFTLNYLSRWSPQPAYIGDAYTGRMDAQRNRESLYGASFDAALGKYVARGELIAVTETKVLAGATPAGFYYQNYTQLSTVLGVDAQLGDWFISGQYFHTHFHGGANAPMAGRWAGIFTGLVTRNLYMDKLKIKLFSAYDINTFGRWFEANMTYGADGGLEFSAGADFFGGPASSTLGLLEDQSRLTFEMKWML